MKTITIIFPHQLFEQSKLPIIDSKIILIEETLFFNHYKFHKQKLAFHRASMKAFAFELETQGVEVDYIEAKDERADIRLLIKSLSESGQFKIQIIDPTDNWLSKRINLSVNKHEVELVQYESPLFINSKDELSSFFRADKKSFFQTSFYKKQRSQRNLLMSSSGQPEGGKWTYDIDNRKPYPKDKTPPKIQSPKMDVFWKEASILRR